MKIIENILPFSKILILSVIILVTGIITGYWIGQTSLGQFMPQLFAIGTVVSFASAVYFATNRHGSPILTKEFVSYNTFFLFCLFLSAAAFGSSISSTIVWQLSPGDRAAGVLPYSDAGAYYSQVLNWPDPFFNAWNSRRPLNAALNIMEFHLGGSTLLGMILIRVVLVSLAVASFIAALSLLAGRSASLAVGFGLIIWTWPYASSMLSEINGITLSSVGYALLFVAFAQKRRIFLFPGLFGIVLANVFRPYNPLMPAVIACVVLVLFAENWRKGFRSILLGALTVSFLAVLIPIVLYMEYGHPDGTPNGNTGTVVLGLARGTDWKEASDYIESKTSGFSEKEKNALMYDLAAKTVIKDIRPMGKALLIGLVKAIYRFQEELGRTIGFSNELPDSARKSQNQFYLFLVKTPTIWMTTFFSLISVGLIFLHIKKTNTVNLISAISVILFITIAPFLFNDGGWRAVATLYPGLALLLIAFPMSVRYRKRTNVLNKDNLVYIQEANSKQQATAYVPIALICFVLIAVPYPALYRYLLGNEKLQYKAFQLDVLDGESPHWSGMNSAVVSPQHIIEWSHKMGYVDSEEFIKRYGNSIRSVR